MSRAPLRMGTRGSALARAQSGAVAGALAETTGEQVDVVTVRTEGDRLSAEGKAPPGGEDSGVFTRALDDALRTGSIDFAVHSLKDLPTEEADGIVLAAVPPREDPSDALVVASRHAGADSIASLPPRARVGTSSPRRVAQLLRLRPDLTCVGMSGNVDTRLRKLEEGAADALLLASAGLARLGLADRITRRLDPREMLPAPGQGALALVCRADDEEMREFLTRLDDPVSHAATQAERILLRALSGGCRAPVGALAIQKMESVLILSARVLFVDGTECKDAEGTGLLEEAHDLGLRVAGRLLAQGAARIIGAARAVDL